MSEATVLVVEDDMSLREALCDTLQMAGYHVATATDGGAALQVMAQERIKMVVSDVHMKPMDGHGLLQQLKSKYPNLPVVLMTAYGNVEKAVQAMHDGATDYLVKPFEAEVLINMVSRYCNQTEVNSDLIAHDARSVELAALAERVAVTDVTVMLSGESGTGKEVFARHIHASSLRADKPFVAINCAAIPENMLEAVLFGYEKGAFTGAQTASMGKFEQAQGGTLLLDEISEMDLGLQAKLLRVLQEKEVERLGGKKTISLDVRVLATSNRNLRQQMATGKFREDLFYRLNVFPLHLPALRDRPHDILVLAKNFVAKHVRDDESLPCFDGAALAKLSAYRWPGNVRELDNVIQRALILKTGNTLSANDIHFEEDIFDLSSASPSAIVEESLSLMSHELSDDLKMKEYQLIATALTQGRSRKGTAETLGISPRTLRYKLAKMREAGIHIPGDDLNGERGE